MKLKKGQKVTLPRLGGDVPFAKDRRRKATVIGEYDTYYMFQVSSGYRECFLKTALNGVKLV